MVQVVSRSIAINCDGMPAGSGSGYPIFADLSIRADLVYRRIWAGIATIDAYQNDVARPSWRTQIKIQDNVGNETVWLDWWTRYGYPQGNFNINGQDDQLMQFSPPFVIEKFLGQEGDKGQISGLDSRSLVFPSLTPEVGTQTLPWRMTMFPMSLTGRISRITMSWSDYSDSAPGTCQLIGGLMVQSQELPFS